MGQSSRSPGSVRQLLGVMVLAHRRPWLLGAIQAQAKQIDPHAVVQFTYDRPTEEVTWALATAEHRQAAPRAVLDHRENFMEVRRWQLDQMRPFNPVYGVLWDDDHLLEDPAEARRVLEEGRADLVYATKAYLWDKLELENKALPTHRSPFFFRLLPGDQFPLDRTINAPAWVHDTKPMVTDLHGRLLDIGYLTQEERERVWRAYKKAGKIDQLTTKLLAPPLLKKVPLCPTLEIIDECLRDRK